jgi:hypothetical protein
MRGNKIQNRFDVFAGFVVNEAAFATANYFSLKVQIDNVIDVTTLT